MERQVTDWIDSYLSYTRNTEPRESYRTWVAISTIASVLKRKCWLCWGSETWYPNFYIILTGPPAARKGTAMKPARAMLDRIGIRIAASESSRQALINKLEAAVINDTYDSGRPYFHCSMTINSPELTVFLKCNDNDMLSMLCDWFDCGGKWDYETVSRETQDVINVWVNLLGATTPTLLQASLPPDAFGSGLISRTLFVYENNKEKIVIYPTLDAVIGEKLLIDLEAIGCLRGQLKLSGDGSEVLDAYTKWRMDVETDPPFTDQRLLKCNERLPQYIWKIAIVASISRSNDLVITLEDFKRAEKLLMHVIKKMPIAFAGVGANPLAAVQQQVIEYIRRKVTVTCKELMAAFYQDANQQQMAEIIGTLAAMNFCTYDVKNMLVHYKGDSNGIEGSTGKALGPREDK